MLLPRIIPCLLLKGPGLVKGVKYADHTYVGDPINAVQIFNTKEVDEIFFLDITATSENRTVPVDLVSRIAQDCLTPFAVGGGIRTVQQAKDLLWAGAEKVCLNSVVFERPELISEIANQFGSQSVVVSLDVKKNFWGTYHLYSHSGTKKESLELDAAIERFSNAGAGEFLVSSIDRDGTGQGYDLELVSRVAKVSKAPVIALGGAGNLLHLQEVLSKTEASAAAAGSQFVFHGKRRAVLINYPDQNELNSIRGGP